MNKIEKMKKNEIQNRKLKDMKNEKKIRKMMKTNENDEK